MATMFRKPKRNFRQRIVRDDSDDENRAEDMETEESNETLDIKPISEIKKSKEKKKKERSKGVLSFDHDEGDASFQIKKSSYSKKIAKQLKRESMMEREAELKDIKKEIKEEPVDVSATENVSEKDKAEVEDRIKKLREEFLTMNGDEADALEGEESDDDSTFKKMLKRGQIPDATTIHQIRKQRQMARDTGDFLPLDDTVKYENSSSRLVRDDDNDKSDEDDEDQRIDFSANKSAIERQRMKDDFLRAEHGSDDDDQEREWEEQQIHKGVTVLQQVPSTQDLYAQDQENTSESLSSVSNGYQGNKLAVKNSGDGVFNQLDVSLKLAGKMEDLTLETMVSRLRERLTGMKDVHRAHMLESEKLGDDLEDSKKSIETCENSVSGLESRYRFFQEMRGYVRDLVECLNEKVPEINSLESRMNNLLRTRATKLASRRQQDIQDQCQAYMTSRYLMLSSQI